MTEHNDSTDAFPDIEIYVKRVEFDAVTAWLSQYFEVTGTKDTREGVVFELKNADQEAFECVVAENVVKGGFASVWFKRNVTKWQTDRECAVDAYEYFKLEVRCSTGGWDGEDEGGWFRFIDDDIKTVNWF
jgi:hypothetical protein